jgi:hypothetical protein
MGGTFDKASCDLLACASTPARFRVWSERAGVWVRVSQVHAVGSWRPRLWPCRGAVHGFVGGAFGGSGDGLLGPCLPDVLLVGVGLVVR